MAYLPRCTCFDVRSRWYLHSRDGVDIAHGRPGQGVEDLIDVWLEMLR